MLMLSFFSWWYGRGWKEVASSLRPRLRNVNEGFSVAQLLRTVFEPWRRIISYPGASLDEKIRARVDNLFSRGIGFVIRFSVLVVAFITTVCVGILTLAEIVIWPLLPLAIPVFLLIGLLS